MDLSTSIAQMSMNMHQTSLQQGIATSVLKKAMDTTTQLASGQIAMFNESAKAFSGDIGAIFDAKA